MVVKVIFWQKKYFYKSNLFALVSKANLIFSSYSFQISYPLNVYSQEISTQNLFISLVPKFFKNLSYSIFLVYLKFVLWTIDQPKPEENPNRENVDTILFQDFKSSTSTMTATVRRETHLHTNHKSSDKSQLYKRNTSRANQELSEMMKTSATLAHRTYRKRSVVLIELPLPLDY
jgi:hypothetical protein